MNKPLTEEERILSFQNKIIERKSDNMSWAETISEYCEDNTLDYEDVVKLISPWLKSHLWDEAVKTNSVIVSKSEKERVGI